MQARDRRRYGSTGCPSALLGLRPWGLSLAAHIPGRPTYDLHATFFLCQTAPVGGEMRWFLTQIEDHAMLFFLRIPPINSLGGEY